MRWHRKFFAISAGAAVLLLVPMGALSAQPPNEKQQEGGDSTATERPIDFETKILSKIHQTNQMEIKAGKLAMERGGTEDVREYGERLVRDHSQADEKVKELAEEKGITLVKLKPQTKKEKQQAEQQPDQQAK